MWYRLFLMGLLLSHNPIFANNQGSLLKIASPTWPGSVNKDGTGTYLELFRTIYAPSAINIVHVNVPQLRDNEMVERGLAEVTFDLFEGESPKMSFPFFPMSAIIGTAVFLKERTTWEGEKSVTDKRVAWILGYDLHKIIPFPVKMYEVGDISQGIDMVMAGRQDFYVDEDTAIKDYFAKNKDKDKAERLGTAKLYTSILFPGFSQTEKGKAFKVLYEKRMIELLKAGTLEAIYKKDKPPEIFNELKAELEKRARSYVPPQAP